MYITITYRLLTTWETHQVIRLREQTHSTASLPGLAFESVRLEGTHPASILAIYFRDVRRCNILFGWGRHFWRHESQWREKCPEAYADYLWTEFFEDLDIMDPELPPTEQCDLAGVTWLASTDDKLGREECPRTPWLGITGG